MIGCVRTRRVTRKRIYIAGPLTSSGDIWENIDTAVDAARILLEMGYAPLVPHLSHYMDPSRELKPSEWMEVHLPWVSVADALLRLPGSSAGADQECREAFERGIPIYHSIPELRRGFAS